VNKRLIIFGVLLAALLLSAVSPWPATLRIWNFTGDNVYLTLKYRGVQKYFLTATPQGNSDTYYLSVFDITRLTYNAQVTACSTTTTWGRLRMASNVRLTFTSCEAMKQYMTPKYWGEPTMEKPNFWNWNGDESVPPNMGWWGSLSYKDLAGTKSAFRFLYDVVP